MNKKQQKALKQFINDQVKLDKDLSKVMKDQDERIKRLEKSIEIQMDINDQYIEIIKLFTK